ncbi:MAG: hypothetical protein WAP52_02495 [Candidatus Sungiibacteriota bacterium]
MNTSTSLALLPDFFRSILWSYDITRLDPSRDRKAIIVQALNYGDLEHWRWLIRAYGRAGIQEMLHALPMTELRPRVRRLVMLLFGIDTFFHASRSTH